ncbi:MAG: four helix bundle protein [Gammaproteobacteria bacterium]|nr:four helix bundle protein [Gammaproteobacteria bacterium]
MKNFRELKVWEKSHQLVLQIYEASSHFPDDEKFGLVSQIKRSASSVPANIAEGCGRGSDLDFARFIQIAIGSACESEYHIFLAKELGYIDVQKWSDIDTNINEVKRMLINLNKKLRS